MNKQVLIVGSNLTLLETRREVLEANGIPSEISHTEAFQQDLPISDTTFLIVACSSLSAAVRQAIVNFSHTADPRRLCLVVEPGEAGEPLTVGADAVLGALEGPEKFVSCVKESLLSHTNGRDCHDR